MPVGRRHPRPDPGRGVRGDASDGPATLNGRPVRASAKDKLSDFVISMALNGRTAATRARNVRKAIRISRSMGSAALALAYVANGRFDAFVQQGGLSAWDVAAAGLIAERGGATVTSMNGGLVRPRASPKSIGILAAPPPTTRRCWRSSAEGAKPRANEPIDKSGALHPWRGRDPGRPRDAHPRTTRSTGLSAFTHGHRRVRGGEGG